MNEDADRLNIRPKVFGSEFVRYYVCFNQRHYYWVKLINIGSLGGVSWVYCGSS